MGVAVVVIAVVVVVVDVVVADVVVPVVVVVPSGVVVVVVVNAVVVDVEVVAEVVGLVALVQDTATSDRAIKPVQSAVSQPFFLGNQFFIFSPFKSYIGCMPRITSFTLVDEGVNI